MLEVLCIEWFYTVHMTNFTRPARVLESPYF